MFVKEEVKASQSEFLKLISGGEKLVLDPTDGKEVLAETYEATGETPVSVYEMVQNGNFSQLFGSLSPETDKLRLTPAQIKGFVNKYGGWLRTEGYATFFLFKLHGNFFVAMGNVYSSCGLRLLSAQFEHSHVWQAYSRHRLVVPS